MTKRKANGVTLEKFYETLLQQTEERAQMEQRLKDHFDKRLDEYTVKHLGRLDGRIDKLQTEHRVFTAVEGAALVVLGYLGLTPKQ